MTKTQIGVLAVAVGLFCVLYFGFDTKPPAQKQIEKSRMLIAESTDINVLLMDAKKELDGKSTSTAQLLEQQLDAAESDSVKVRVLKQLSSEWFKWNRPDIAGYYAEELAGIENTEAAWSISGTTYLICLQRMEQEKVRDFCSGRAVRAFENAISLNPDNVNNRLNLALTYVEYPPDDNPMKGILLLRDLSEQHPENVLVLQNLGRLAIKTGQYEKARERLEKALALAPAKKDIICLLAQTYSKLNEAVKAAEFQKRCQKLSDG